MKFESRSSFCPKLKSEVNQDDFFCCETTMLNYNDYHRKLAENRKKIVENCEKIVRSSVEVRFVRCNQSGGELSWRNRTVTLRTLEPVSVHQYTVNSSLPVLLSRR